MRNLENTTMARARHLAALLPLSLLVGCGDAGDESATGATGTLDGPDVIVNAVTEEVFTVGSVLGDTWDTFGSVRSVHFDAQSNLHILDSQLDHILVVGPDGSLVRTIGGRGEGPGEFSNVLSVIVGRDGSYTVLGFTTIDLLHPDGEFVRRVTMDPMTTGLIFASMALPDGRLVTSALQRFGAQDDHYEAGRPIHVFPLDGAEPEVLYTAGSCPRRAKTKARSSRQRRVQCACTGRRVVPSSPASNTTS